MNKDTGGAAFPSSAETSRAIYGDAYPDVMQGMTLRDYFAAKAMQAMTSDPVRVRSLAAEAERQNLTDAQEVSLQAYVLADTMIAERAK